MGSRVLTVWSNTYEYQCLYIRFYKGTCCLTVTKTFCPDWGGTAELRDDCLFHVCFSPLLQTTWRAGGPETRGRLLASDEEMLSSRMTQPVNLLGPQAMAVDTSLCFIKKQRKGDCWKTSEKAPQVEEIAESFKVDLCTCVGFFSPGCSQTD